MRLSLVPPHPIDWDHQTYCTHPACTRPATHQRLVALTFGSAAAIYELVCCTHAHTQGD